MTHNIEQCHSGGLEVAHENNVFVLTKTSFSKLKTSSHCFRPYLAAFECNRLALNLMMVFLLLAQEQDEDQLSDEIQKVGFAIFKH